MADGLQQICKPNFKATLWALNNLHRLLPNALPSAPCSWGREDNERRELRDPFDQLREASLVQVSAAHSAEGRIMFPRSLSNCLLQSECAGPRLVSLYSLGV